MRLREPRGGEARRKRAAGGKTLEVLVAPTEEKFDLRTTGTEQFRSRLIESIEDSISRLQQGPGMFDFSHALETAQFLFPDQPITLTPAQREKVLASLSRLLVQSMNNPLVDFSVLIRYTSALTSLFSIVPESREAGPPSHMIGVSNLFGLKSSPVDWQLPPGQIREWLRMIENYKRPPSISPEFQFVCDAVLVLVTVAPETRDRLHAVVEKIVQRTPSQTLSRLDQADRYFPILLAFPDLKQYFPFGEEDVSSLREWWTTELAKDRISTETVNHLAKALLVTTADELRLVDGRVEYRVHQSSQTAKPLPNRLAI